MPICEVEGIALPGITDVVREAKLVYETGRKKQ